MFSLLSSRRIAAAAAGAALISMTAACGGGANSAFCTDAPWTKLSTEYSSAVAAAGGDLSKYNDATQKFSAGLKDLAGQAEGELATALNEFATAVGNVKFDANDPTAAATAATELGQKTQALQAKLVEACA
jgi:hypothetical protein